jgi:hypothetical protein
VAAEALTEPPRHGATAVAYQVTPAARITAAISLGVWFAAILFGRVTPNDAELTAFYQQHLDRYSSIGFLTVLDLIAGSHSSGTAAEDSLAIAVSALRAGQPLAAVKAQFGLEDSGAITGEQVYFAAKLHLGDRLFAAASALTAGQAAGPIQAKERASPEHGDHYRRARKFINVARQASGTG